MTRHDIEVITKALGSELRVINVRLKALEVHAGFEPLASLEAEVEELEARAGPTPSAATAAEPDEITRWMRECFASLPHK